VSNDKKAFMKTFILAVFALSIFGCEENNIQYQNDLYAEWEWKATKMLNGNVYSSAQQLDSTYYYNFKENGILEIKDINKVVKYEKPFKIVQGGQFHGTIAYNDVNNTELHFSYSIANRELEISNMEGIIVWIDVFKAIR
jgi:hypothetical protein